jgi:D-alanyl-D-alanine carboxypeptidase
MRRSFDRGRLKMLVVAIFAAISGGLAHADKVDDFIQAEMKRHQIPGLSLAVLQKGKILKAKGYGFANVELNEPATAETVYQLASITKSFTATAVMQLVEDGKLTLNDKIAAHLPGLPKAWSEVTVWHLLTHTSGIKSYTQLAAIADNPQKEFSSGEMIALVADLPLEFRPGERYDYSNTGYYLLGLLIEKISGQRYGAFLDQRIFKPAGMTSTRVNSFADLIPRRAAGYMLRDGGIRNGILVNPSQPFAAGALVTSASDLAKWDAALYTDKIVKQSTLQQMWTPAKLGNGTMSNYGLGWGTREREGRRYVQHNGGIIGFSTHLRRGLDDGLTIIVLANLSGRGIYAEEIAESLVPFYLRGN